MNTPEQRPWWERVSPDLVAEFVEHYQKLRENQRYYRHTLDPFTRRELVEIERQADALHARIRAELVADQAAVEGGVL